MFPEDLRVSLQVRCRVRFYRSLLSGPPLALVVVALNTICREKKKSPGTKTIHFDSHRSACPVCPGGAGGGGGGGRGGGIQFNFNPGWGLSLEKGLGQSAVVLIHQGN